MIEPDHLLNIMRRNATQASAHQQQGTRVGIVTSFDPTTQTAKVMLQPEGYETGYLRVKAAWAGPGWGLFAPPHANAEVDVHFEDGSIDGGYIGLRAHSDVDNPLPCPSGELWIAHSSGLSLRLMNNGTAMLGGKAADSSIILGNPADLHRLVKDTFMQLFNEHTHGGGPVPTQQMTLADHFTKETTAS